MPSWQPAAYPLSKSRGTEPRYSHDRQVKRFSGAARLSFNTNGEIRVSQIDQEPQI